MWTRGELARAVGVRLGGQRTQQRRLALREHALAAAGQLGEGARVHGREPLGDGGVGLGEAEEGAVPQRRQDLALGDLHADLDLGLVARLGHARGHDHAAVVGGELGVGRRDLGLVAVGLLHAGLQVVGHDELGGAAEVFEGAGVGIEEALRALVRVGAREGVVREAQHGEEEVRLPDLAGLGVCVRQRVAGPVDEQLLAGAVVLAHDHVDAAPPGAVTLGIPGVAVAVRVSLAVLGPEQAQGEVLVSAAAPRALRPSRARAGRRPPGSGRGRGAPRALSR